MSVFERVLEAGSTEMPVCRCGGEMHIASTKVLQDRDDACIRIYRCASCQHELQLTVWADSEPA